jgi:hypothetical protein
LRWRLRHECDRHHNEGQSRNEQPGYSPYHGASQHQFISPIPDYIKQRKLSIVSTAWKELSLHELHHRSSAAKHAG